MNSFLIGPTDTDSISFCKKDMSPFLDEELNNLLKNINDISPEFIEWEDDGYYKACITLKAKNYVLWDGKKKTIKGSAFKTSSKEPAMKEMMNEIVDTLIKTDNKTEIISIYNKYIKESQNVQDIKRWCQKKTITESVMDCAKFDATDDEDDSPRKNEMDVWNAVKNEEAIQQGDKIYLYSVYLGKAKRQKEKFKKDKTTGEKISQGMVDEEYDLYGLRLSKYYNNDVANNKLIKRVYDTMNIFKTILDMDLFPKYHLKGNKEKLDLLLTST